MSALLISPTYIPGRRRICPAFGQDCNLSRSLPLLHLRLHLHEDILRRLLEVLEESWTKPSFSVKFWGIVDVSIALLTPPLQVKLVTWKRSPRKYHQEPIGGLRHIRRREVNPSISTCDERFFRQINSRIVE